MPPIFLDSSLEVKSAAWPYFNASELRCSRGPAVPMFLELCTWERPAPQFPLEKKHIFNTATRVRDACPPIFVRVELADLTRAVPSRALAKFAVWPYFNTSELHCSRGLAVPMFSELSMWERPVPQFPLEKKTFAIQRPVLGVVHVGEARPLIYIGKNICITPTRMQAQFLFESILLI